MVCIEINRQYNKSILLNAWYRPPSSDMNLLDEYAEILCKCGVENKELIVLGDLICDVDETAHDNHTRKLLFIRSLYHLITLLMSRRELRRHQLP